MWNGNRSSALSDGGDSASNDLAEDEFYMDFQDAEALLNSLSPADQQALISRLDKVDEGECFAFCVQKAGCQQQQHQPPKYHHTSDHLTK